MAYHHIPYEELKAFCERVFTGYGFTPEDAGKITDVLLAADLYGIESHGVQRLIRYHQEFLWGYVKLGAVPEIVKETPVSATVDGHDMAGQTLGIWCMEKAIEKAKQSGIGMVAVRNCNHFGIAGYYARMAMEQGLLGVAMTNAEAIMVPTFGAQAMVGTNPIAVAMPADPVPFAFDSATTVVPRGKLEVFAKREGAIPDGWAIDEEGNPCTDAPRVLHNIINCVGGGILPLGGAGEQTSGYKGYGFGVIVDLFTAMLSGGLTSNYIYRTEGRADISQFYMAIDPGLFGDPQEIKDHFSFFLQQLRDSRKAKGQERIYTHGEKAQMNKERALREGILVNDKTYGEMKMIAEYCNCADALPALTD